ncbi:hypothetical protein DM01DRAFT_1409467, partial [Hesseltinella vesiculosa]
MPVPPHHHHHRLPLCRRFFYFIKLFVFSLIKPVLSEIMCLAAFCVVDLRLLSKEAAAVSSIQSSRALQASTTEAPNWTSLFISFEYFQVLSNKCTSMV